MITTQLLNDMEYDLENNGGVLVKKFICVLLISCSMLYAYDTSRIYAIGDKAGVPLSVVRALMHEESRGNERAVSTAEVNGYHSKGLFQIYEKPENLNWLLLKFWNEPVSEFDIYDAYDNATVALRYLSWLHDWQGTWYKALLFYNHGDVETASEHTKAYAKKIINAR